MNKRAFTLVEILVVIVVISIILTLAVPAFNSLGKAQSLTGAGNNLLDHLAEARQIAVARNRTVEIRFYKLRENPDIPVNADSNPEKFRAFRTLIYEEGRDPLGRYTTTPVALKNLQSLPSRMVISDEQSFSTLIHPYGDTNPPRTFQMEDLSDTEKDVPYQVVRFKATGGTDLGVNGTPDGDKWFLSIKSDGDPPLTTGTGILPASNFFTIMLDPVSGRTRAYRP